MKHLNGVITQLTHPSADVRSVSLEVRFKLLSWHDVKRFFATAFSTAFLHLEMLQGDSIILVDDEEGWRKKAQACLGEMEKECREAGFDRLADRCALQLKLPEDASIVTACYLLRDLLRLA